MLQKAIDKAKDQSKDDKQAIAGGLAIFVVVVLLIVWGFFFLKKMQRGVETIDLRAGAQDEFNFSTVREAQQAIQDSFQYTDEELRAVRNSVIERQLPGEGQTVDLSEAWGNTDQFGNSAQ